MDAINFRFGRNIDEQFVCVYVLVFLFIFFPLKSLQSHKMDARLQVICLRRTVWLLQEQSLRVLGVNFSTVQVPTDESPALRYSSIFRSKQSFRFICKEINSFFFLLQVCNLTMTRVQIYILSQEQHKQQSNRKLKRVSGGKIRSLYRKILTLAQPDPVSTNGTLVMNGSNNY